MSESSISVTRIDTNGELETCFAIRREVFVEEQNVSAEEEYDGLDPECLHYLLTVDGAPMATSRMRLLDGKAKVQRVAVRKLGRGTGLGLALMRKMLDDARAEGCVKAVLSSQTYAIPFYERLGFIAHGPEYLDAGIPHRDMTLTF
jgi:predicted GNAT family N-acyltransferase